MGLFSKKKKHENNQINNKELKENLANYAMSILNEGEHYKSLAYTKCEFGYLFNFEGHGLEALFKITTDVDTFYFAAQGNSLQFLNFNEELFNSTTVTFLGMHGE